MSRFLCVLCMLCAAGSLAAAPTVEFSGYADVRAGYTLGETDEFALNIGRIEVTADALILPWMNLEVTIGTYNTMEGKYNAELGGAFISFFKENDGTTMSLNIGYFDVPFGLASGWYAFPENSFMYAPGVTEAYIGEWTDLGVYGSIETEQFSLTAFAVRGEMYGIFEELTTPPPLPPGASALVDMDKGLAVGLRAAFSPVEGLTLGVNYALNAHYDFNDNISFIAGDVEWALGPLALAFEYLAYMPKFAFGDRADTWFAQAMFGLEDIADIPVEFGARFDYFAANYSNAVTALLGAGTPPPAGESSNALTIQANWLADEHLRFGLSFRHQKDEDDIIMLQVMGMF
ncbi:MAG: hypothetical protein LBC99_10670 [Spirochaetota bacterium]|nr:hypothetical protein [Spirochaetota bacterium]